jgi:hypothetical protein
MRQEMNNGHGNDMYYGDDMYGDENWDGKDAAGGDWNHDGTAGPTDGEWDESKEGTAGPTDGEFDTAKEEP